MKKKLYAIKTHVTGNVYAQSFRISGLMVLLFILGLARTGAQVIFYESFDGISGPTAGGAGTYTFPSGWFLRNVDGRAPNAAVSYVNDAWERREDFAYNVNDSAAFSTSWYTPTGQADDWMWTPLIGPLPANTTLSWNAIAYDPSYADGYEVRIMTSAFGPPTGSTGIIGNQLANSTQVFSIAAENSAWTARSVSLAAYAGQSVYVGFRNHSTDMFLLLIDDVKLEAPLTCPAPTGVTVSDITSNSAGIGWTGTTPEPVNGYQYYYSTSNVAPGPGTTPSGTAAVFASTIGTDQRFVAVDGLIASTGYYVWVRADCGGNGFSSWAGPANFTTLPAATPYCNFTGTLNSGDLLRPLFVANGNAGPGCTWSMNPQSGFVFGTSPGYIADQYTITNGTGSAQCVTFTLSHPNTGGPENNISFIVFKNAFPTNADPLLEHVTNTLAYPYRYSCQNTGTGAAYHPVTVSVTLAAGQTAYIQVHKIEGADMTVNYNLNVSGLPCDAPCVLTCPANITVPNTPNTCGAAVSFTVTSTGNCGTITAIPASGSIFPVGTTTVSVSSTSGATCTFTVTVNDVQPPTIACPTSITVSCANLVPAPDPGGIIASDNCPGLIVEFVDDVISNFVCRDRYTITRTYRARDLAGNTAACQQVITVNDVTAPTLNCPPPVTVSCAAAVPPTDLSSVTGVSENCGAPISISWRGDVISNQTCDNRYTITRTYRVTDLCGNFTECTQIITVNDQTPPTLNCPAPVTVCGAANVPAPNTASVTGVSDNCSGPVIVTHQGDAGTPNPNAPYVITRTYRATDACGNFAECTQAITVNPIPNAVATPSSQTVCSGTPITAIMLSGNVTGTTFNWTRDNVATVTGIAGSGSGNISGTLTNTTNAPVTVTFTVIPTANGCPGTVITATVLVNPTPNVTAVPASQAICNSSAITTITMSGSVAGTVFNWTRDNVATVTGIAGSGSGNISGTLTNTTNAPVTVTFTITPTANGCNGIPLLVTILVAPTPTVDPVANQTVCTGTPTAPVNFTGPVAGTTYSWTNNTPSIGLGASGTGNIPSFVATNPTTLPVTATVTVTPSVTVSSSLIPEQLYYRFDGSGSTVPNLSTAPPPGTATATLTGLTQGNTGLCGGALVGTGGTGASNFMNTNWNPNMTGPWTLSFWLGPNQVDNNPSYLFGALSAGSFRCFYGGAAGANNVLLRGGSGDVLITGVNPAATLITVVYNGTNTVVYKNGGSPQTYNVTFNNIGTTPLYVGSYNTTATISSMNGRMDEFKLFSRALNASEVQLLTGCTQQVCTGPQQAFTYTVNPLPTISCPANINATTPVGSCTASVNYTPTITGTPAPAVTYTFSGATTGSGSGTGSGSAFNIGTTTVTVTASNVCATVNCSFTITVADGQLPVITAQPANQTVCSGTNATFTVTVTNAVSYQWQSWNGSAWVDISGATNATLTISNATTGQNTNSYRVRVIGRCTSVISNHATLYVNPNPTVTITASIPPQLIPTQVLNLTAVPSVGGGSYQWYVNGTSIAGATTQVLGGLTVDDAGTYRVVYRDANNCVGTSADLVVTARQSDNLWVYPNPNNGQFTIRFFNRPGEEVTVRILASDGHEVFRQKVIAAAPYSSIQVDLTGKFMASETYVVEIRNSQGTQVGAKRIIVYR